MPIPRRVMVERMIEMPGGDVPEDYRFFVYHGRVHFLQVDFVRFEGYTGNSYDREWNLLPVRVKYPPSAKPVPKPAKLDQMTEIAEKIGARSDFARVDLYAPPEGILFGEVTFYPEGGIQAFTPKEWDYKFGEPWEIVEYA